MDDEKEIEYLRDMVKLQKNYIEDLEKIINNIDVKELITFYKRTQESYADVYKHPDSK